MPQENNINYKMMFIVIARWTALLSGVFIVLFFLLICVEQYRAKKIDPATLSILKTLRKEIDKNPSNNELVEQFREIDFVVRRAYLASIMFSRTGALVLFFTAFIFIISLKVSVYLKDRMPVPIENSEIDSAFSANLASVRMILLLIMIITVLGLILILLNYPQAGKVYESSVLSSRKPAPNEVKTNTLLSEKQIQENKKPAPSDDEILSNWPSFRGPFGTGISTCKEIPCVWDTNTNLIWKTEVPKIGFGSPVIWNELIFLSGADSDTREIYCFSLKDGSLIWKQNLIIPGSTQSNIDVMDDTGYAAPSMAVDGRFACAIFANGDLGCFKFDGTLLWKKSLGIPENPYGYASSPVIFKDSVIIQYDNSNASFASAFNLWNGNIIWTTKRDFSPSWSSPVIFRNNSEQVLAINGNPFSVIYNPSTGQEILRTECLTNDLAVSPVCYNENFLLSSGSGEISVFKHQSNDLAWKITENVPDVSTPLLTQYFVCTAAPDGTVNFYDIKTGYLIKNHSFEGAFYASPVMAASKVFLADKTGKIHVFEADKNFDLISSVDMREPVFATPAFADNKIIIRTQKTIYCIGNKN